MLFSQSDFTHAVGGGGRGELVSVKERLYRFHKLDHVVILQALQGKYQF